MDTATTNYEVQAAAFLERFAIAMTIERVRAGSPPWDKGRTVNVYSVTLKHDDREDFEFPFYGSVADFQAGKHPTPYDVLACISSDASCPTDADEVYEEFGDMKPSQAQAVAEFADRLQTWFLSGELEALGEIR